MSVTTPPRRRAPAPPARPPTGGPPPTAPGGPPEEPPRHPPIRGSIKGILLGCLVVLVCVAAGTAVAVLDEVHTLRDALSANASLKIKPGALANAGWGQPETLLLVGDDWRAQTKYYHVAVPHLANEMLLVRLDPSKPYISMMSIPRELWVTIYPPNGIPYTNRLNSAYTYGTTTLVSTIKHVLGIPVNHVIAATFQSFRQAVDAMGCVYSSVDRRYFNLNLGTPDTNYQSINLQPGYQKMCGEQALEFVSYRHADTSLIRDARDQSFLMDVKKQYGPTLADNVHKFEQIFGRAVRTDPGLHSTTEILNLLGTLISMSSRRVRQVHFQASLLATHDVASPQQTADSVHNFLYGGSEIPAHSVAATAHAVHSRPAAARLPLVTVPQGELSQAKAAAAQLPFPLEYPRAQDRGGAGVPPMLRGYMIHAPDGSAYPIYVAVFYAGQLGAYYDVQGTTWTTAPMFSSPDQKVAVGARTYSIFYEGSHIKTIAWFEHGAVYWVRNSLTDSVSNGEMLAVAEQAEPFMVATAPGPGRTPARVILKAANVPTRQPVVQKLGALKTIGSLGGLLTVLAVPLLGIALLVRTRGIARARAQLQASAPAGARLSEALAHIPYVPRAPAPRSLQSLVERRNARRRTQRVKLILGAAAGVLVAAAAGVLIAERTGHHAHRRAAVAGSRDVPTIPVSVLNAGAVQGAAGTLAGQLRARGVNIGTVANDPQPQSTPLEIRYAQGERRQALALERMLSASPLGGRSPTLAPLDAATTSVAGYGAKLVVVIG